MGGEAQDCAAAEERVTADTGLFEKSGDEQTFVGETTVVMEVGREVGREGRATATRALSCVWHGVNINAVERDAGAKMENSSSFDFKFFPTNSEKLCSNSEHREDRCDESEGEIRKRN